MKKQPCAFGDLLCITDEAQWGIYGRRSQSVQADVLGEFELEIDAWINEGFESGQVGLEVSWGGKWAIVDGARVSSPRRINVDLGDTGTVTGIVENANGGTAGVSIFRHQKTTLYTPTDSLFHYVEVGPDGFFEIDSLPPGDWILGVGKASDLIAKKHLTGAIGFDCAVLVRVAAGEVLNVTNLIFNLFDSEPLLIDSSSFVHNSFDGVFVYGGGEPWIMIDYYEFEHGDLAVRPLVVSAIRSGVFRIVPYRSQEWGGNEYGFRVVQGTWTPGDEPIVFSQ